MRSKLSAKALLVVIASVLVGLSPYGPSAWAQGALGKAMAQKTAATAPAQVRVDDLRVLLATIEDEAKRKELARQIRGLIAVGGKSATETPAPPGSGFISDMAANVKNLSRELVAAADALSNFPVVMGWLATQFTDADARANWLDLLAKLLIVLAAGGIGEWLARRLLDRPRQALETREAETLAVRLVVLLGRTVLDLVPVVVFAAVAYAVIPLARPGAQAHVVVLTIIYAYVVARGLLVAVRMVLVPAVPALRVLPLADETANYLFIWIRRLVTVLVYGYFLAEAALLLGIPWGGYEGLLRLLGLLVAAMTVVLILQNRAQVTAWLRGGGDSSGFFGFGSLRGRFADVWHVAAMVYVVGIYAVWALDVHGGFGFLARATVVSAVILALGKLVLAGLHGGVRRAFAISDDVKARFPTLEARANRYVPVLDQALRTLVCVVVALALLQTWGLDAFGWLDTPMGGQIVQSAVSIAAVVIIALVVWELINASIERYLSETDADGNQVERGARVRTLLPLLRNVILVVMSVLVALIVLSELGVNIAPLLAGAGVVGLAVGFGAQTLVKDVITGAFILFEDTISVGDVVAVGSHQGLVEAISIRSIRLRDLSGNVHTIPFSSVDTVTNLTKEFSYAVFEVGVGYREDTDAVTEVLGQIGADMQADAEYGADILAELEVLGVDKFADSAVVIKARLKTAPGRQWSAGREFNRRMKIRFDELDIEIPFPHRTLYFGVDKSGGAPAGRIRLDDGGDD